MSNCTCGPYMSVIPPEPCAIHDPERAYWRAKYLREFGSNDLTWISNDTTITTATPPPRLPSVYV